MKRICRALIVCLMLLCAQQALAAGADLSGKVLLEQVAALYDQYGAYETWPQEGYDKAAGLLCDAGVLEDEGLLSGAKDAGQTLLEALPGPSSRFIRRVAVSLWGEDDLWTQENAYWYTELMMGHGLLLSTDKVYMIPGADAISAAEAEQAALDYVRQRYNCDPAAREDAKTYCTYYAPRATQTPRWRVVFCGGDSRLFTVEVDDRGNIGDASMHLSQDPDAERYIGLIALMSLEEQAKYAQSFNIPMYGFPDSDDIQEEEARRIARDVLAAQGILYDQFDEYVSFVITGMEEIEFPYWGVYYTNRGGERTQYSVLISASSGAVLDFEAMDWSSPGRG